MKIARARAERGATDARTIRLPDTRIAQRSAPAGVYDPAVRILARRIWRAFPELDAYDDAECRRFVKIARRRAHRRWLHAGAAVLAGVVTMGVVATVIIIVFGRMLPQVNGVDLRWWYLGWSGVVFGVVGLPAAASLAVRDHFLRRRLADIVQGSGVCPICRYRLIGLAIPESLKLHCPECGHLCAVDSALSTLARDSDAVVGATSVVFVGAEPRWTRERTRRVLRRAAIVGAIVVLSVSLPLGWNEWRVRSQSALAIVEKPTTIDAVELVRRLRPGARLDDEPVVLRTIQRISERMEALRSPLRSTVHGPERPIRPAFDLVLAPADLERDGQRDPEVVEASIALAERHIKAYEKGDLFSAFDALARTPIAVRSMSLPVPGWWGVSLPYRMQARGQARMLGARARLAIARDDTETAAESLAAIAVLARAIGSQPTVFEWEIGHAIERLGHAIMKRWLASSPQRHELDAMDRVLRDAGPFPLPDLAYESEALVATAQIAAIFADVDTMRWAPLRSASSALMGMTERPTGTWRGNRDAITASIARARASFELEPFQRADPSALPARPRSTDADLARVSLTDGGALATAVDMLRIDRRAIATLIAIERWRLEHGATPPSVEALVPRWLDAVPIDPWSGEPLGLALVDPAIDALGRSFLLQLVRRDGIDDAELDAVRSAPIEFIREPSRAPADPAWPRSVLNDAAPIPRGSAR